MWGGGSHSDPARPQHQRGAVMWPALGYDTPRSPRPAAHNSPLPTEPGKTPQAPSSHFPQLSCCARPPPQGHRVLSSSRRSYIARNSTSWSLSRDWVPTRERQGLARAGLRGQGSPDGTASSWPMGSPRSVWTPTRVRPHHVRAGCRGGPVAVAGQPEGGRTACVWGLPDH